MFIIKNNNKVIYGPAQYNAGMFKYILIEECELQDVVVPFSLEIGEKVIINDEISILPAEFVYPNINSKIEQFAGPFWSFEYDKAIGTFEKADKSIDSVKSDLKVVVSDNRRKYETKDIELQINSTDVVIDASRENKANVIATYNLMQVGSTINFKFKNYVFLECSKEDLGIIVNAFNEQVNSAFNFEYYKIGEIETAISLEELDNIILIDESKEVQNGIKNPVIGE